MRFTLLLPRFHTNIYFLVKALLSRGHEVSLIVEKPSDGLGLVYPIAIGNDFSWKTALRLLRSNPPDLLIARKLNGSWRWFSIFGLVLAKQRVAYDQLPFLGPPRPKFRWSRVFRGLPLRRLTPVLRRAYNTEDHPDPSAFYLPFPVEVSPRVQERCYAPGGRVRILCIAKLAQPRKRHFLLLDVLARLITSFNFETTIAGSATLNASGATQEYLDRLLAQTASGPLSGHLTILKDVPFSEMTSLYFRHDVVVLPSEKEPLGTAPLEAMACGCVPVISDDCGSAGYIAEECGFTFASGDSEALFHILKKLLASPELCEKMGAAAVATVLRNYNPDRCAERLEAIARGTLQPADTLP